MNTKFKSKIFLLTTVLAAFVQIIYFYSQLPTKVAIHFNGTGFADSYEDKLTTSIIQISIIIILSSMFYLFSLYLNKIPNSLINLPYKKYWLSSERRKESLNIISGELLRIVSLTNLLLMLIFYLAAKASINGTYKLDTIAWWFLIIYFVFITIDVIKLYRFFSKPKQDTYHDRK